MNLCRTVGRKEARFRGVAATADRIRWEKRTGVGRRRHRCSGDTDPNVHEGDRETSSLKKKTTVLWPWRGRRELRQRCWSFFDDSCRSRTARTGYAS